MNFKTDYRLENFILNIKWEKLPKEVQNRLVGCFVDLMGALICGSRSEQFKAGLALAEKVYKSGEIAVYARKDLKLIQSTYTGRVYYAGVA